MRLVRSACAASLACCALGGGARSALAQDFGGIEQAPQYSRGFNVAVRERPHPDWSAFDIDVGGFTLGPQISVTSLFNDNEKYATDDKRGDVSFRIQPAFQLGSNWNRNGFGLSAFVARTTSVQDGSLQSDAQVVSPAQVPLKPSSPNKKLDIALGVIFGLFAGTVAVVGMEMWSGEVRTSDDVEKMLGVPAIGSVPTTKGATNRSPTQYLIDTPLSAFAESFRQLRAALRRADLDSPVKTLAVTSALPGEGKSTTSMCLARSVALGGQKTIAVDCDLRRRTLHTMLAIKPAVGLLEVLAGTARLEDAIIVDEPSGCHILPLTASKFTPRDVFGTQAFAKLVAHLKANYDFVILDCAPVLAVADTRTITEVVDGVLVLAQWQKTAARAVKYAISAVEAVGGKVLGVALTKVNLKAQAAYGYGDSGYYFRSYANYYVER